jgi:hypothetical protein
MTDDVFHLSYLLYLIGLSLLVSTKVHTIRRLSPEAHLLSTLTHGKKEKDSRLSHA